MKFNARNLLIDGIESAPSIVFLSLLRLGSDLEAAGWVGATLSGIALIILFAVGKRYDAILLGINIHLLAVTPVIVGIFELGAVKFGEILTHYSYQGVLITIFIVGLILTLSSSYGFTGEDEAKSSVKKNSIILLTATFLSITWSFTYGGEAFIGVAAPIIGLFIVRHIIRREGATGRVA